MTRNISVFDELCDIAESKKPLGYLRAYERDLYEHDKNTLDINPYGASRWLWVLRGCGTALFPIGVGHDAVWATYWLTRGNERETPSLAYLIDLNMAHRVKPVDYDRATRLANTPHPDGIKVKVSLTSERPY